jgi:hypothetical protein
MHIFGWPGTNMHRVRRIRAHGRADRFPEAGQKMEIVSKKLTPGSRAAEQSIENHWVEFLECILLDTGKPSR